MVNDPIGVSIKCKIGEPLKPGFDSITIGKYTFSQLPLEQQSGFKTELLLTFKDKWGGDQKRSNPEKEGEIILAWLSVILRQKVKGASYSLNNVNILRARKENISFETAVIFPERINELYAKLKSMSLSGKEKILQRYIRACEFYQEALILSNIRPHISFFLFIVSIECLCKKGHEFYPHLISKLKEKEAISKEEIDKAYVEFNREHGLKNNFVEFILSHYNDWNDKFTREEFRNLLCSIYNIRSKFIHEGENIQEYIDFVDLNLRCKTVFIKEKEEFPGLNYLSDIVGKVLINFLDTQQISDVDNLPKLALEYGKVNVLSTKPVVEGEFLFHDHFKYRK